MEFKEIKVAELVEFVNSEFYNSLSVKPISKQRAYSQSRNPNASPDDIALIVALNNENEVVGYSGILPDSISCETPKKAFWNSCWWINKTKGNGVAMKLFYKTLLHCNKNMVYSELTETTSKIVETMKIAYTPYKLNFYRFFLKSNFQFWLPKKNNFFVHIKFLLKILDFFVNFCLNSLQFIFKKNFNEISYQFENINYIDSEVVEFLKLHTKSFLLNRNKETLNWFLSSEWIVKSPDAKDINSPKYYFSSLAKQYDKQAVKIFQNNELKAFLLITCREGEVKIPYSYYSKNDIPLIAKFLFNYLSQSKTKSISVVNEDFVKIIENSRVNYFFKRTFPKNFALSNVFPKECVFNKTVQDGDGDLVFT